MTCSHCHLHPVFCRELCKRCYQRSYRALRSIQDGWRGSYKRDYLAALLGQVKSHV